MTHSRFSWTIITRGLLLNTPTRFLHFSAHGRAFARRTVLVTDMQQHVAFLCMPSRRVCERHVILSPSFIFLIALLGSPDTDVYLRFKYGTHQHVLPCLPCELPQAA
ncbi:unnamed protein product [Pylaiella littoralis]